MQRLLTSDLHGLVLIKFLLAHDIEQDSELVALAAHSHREHVDFGKIGRVAFYSDEIQTSTRRWEVEVELSLAPESILGVLEIRDAFIVDLAAREEDAEAWEAGERGTQVECRRGRRFEEVFVNVVAQFWSQVEEAEWLDRVGGGGCGGGGGLIGGRGT